jgi:hypothetical protein
VADTIIIETGGSQGIPGVGVPEGGSTGQVLTKASNDSFDTEWSDPTAEVGELPTAESLGLDAFVDLTPAALSISVATQTALDSKANTSHTQAIGTITDLQAALDAKSGTGHGHATSDITGLVALLNALQASITSLEEAGPQTPLGAVDDEAEMLALVGTTGDYCVRRDTGTVWTLIDDDPTELASWFELTYASSPVTSVNEMSGAVVLTKSNIGLANVDNTSDANKPVSTATQTALNGKADTSHTQAISTVTGLQAALDAKAATSHTQAISTVTGLQTALDGKATSSHTHAISAITDLQTTLTSLQSQINAAPYYVQDELLDDGTEREIELHNGAVQVHGPGGSVFGVVRSGDTVEVEVTYIGGGGDVVDGSPFVGPVSVTIPIVDLEIATVTIQRTAGTGELSRFMYTEATAFQVLQYIGEEQDTSAWQAGSSTDEGPVSPVKAHAAALAVFNANTTAASRGVIDQSTTDLMLTELGLSSNGASLVKAADYDAMKVLLGSTVADGSITLAKLANLAQDQFIGRTTASTGVPETATITAAARTVLDDTTVGAMVNTLGGATSGGTGGIARLTDTPLVTPLLGTPQSGVLTNCSYGAITLETCLALTPASYAWQRRFVTTANSGAVKINAEFFCDGTIWQPVSNYLGFANNTPSSTHTGGTSDSGTLMTITIPRALVLPGYEMRVRGDITKVGTAGALTGRCNFNGTQCYSTTGSAGNLGALPGTHIRVTSSTVQRSNGPGSGNEQDIRASYTFTAHAVNLGTTDPVFTFTLQLADGADSGQYLAAYVDLIRRAVQ